MDNYDENALMGLYLDSSLQEIKNYEIEPKIPYISLLSDRCVVYYQNECRSIKRCNDVVKLENLKKNKASGIIKNATASKIRKILDTWLSSIIVYNKSKENVIKRNEHFPIFITLTLSSKQIHSDKYIKRYMLSEFIDKLKYNEGIEHVFWRAESQKNGNIHFHVITDKYIKKEDITKYWNTIQITHSYIEKNDYLKNPEKYPSTNVKGVKDVGNFVQYVIKYAIKNESSRPIEGRCYGMTDSIRNIQPIRTAVGQTELEEIEVVVKSNKITKVMMEHATLLKMNIRDKQYKEDTWLGEYYKKCLLELYSRLYKGFGYRGEIEESIECIKNEKSQEIEIKQLTIYDMCVDYCIPIMSKYMSIQEM